MLTVLMLKTLICLFCQGAQAWRGLYAGMHLLPLFLKIYLKSNYEHLSIVKFAADYIW
jgi:hypothetical protein